VHIGPESVRTGGATACGSRQREQPVTQFAEFLCQRFTLELVAERRHHVNAAHAVLTFDCLDSGGRAHSLVTNAAERHRIGQILLVRTENRRAAGRLMLAKSGVSKLQPCALSFLA
jgi:hypothetical protein